MNSEIQILMLYLINYSMRNAVLFHPFLMLIHVPVHAKSGMHLAVFLQNEVFLLSPGRVVNSAKAAWGKQTQCGLTTGPGSKFLMAGGNLAPRGLGSGESSHCTAASQALCPEARICPSGPRVLGSAHCWQGRRGRADSAFRRMEMA